jgi:hypothetical protein
MGMFGLVTGYDADGLAVVDTNALPEIPVISCVVDFF